MARVMLLMGGNLGGKAAVKQRLDVAVELIGERVGHVVRCSSQMVSEPWGFSESERVQPFVNQAVEVETMLTPEELLEATQSIEQSVGRQREVERSEKLESGERYASRVIDVDIILYDTMIYNSERLSIPHPLMQERVFVLEPIVEITPEWVDPRSGLSCRKLLQNIK